MGASGGKTGNFESEQVVNEILRNLSLLTQDYQKKTEQIKTLMKSNEKFVLELKEKQVLLNRKNDEIRELKNNAEKYKELVKQLTSEAESLKAEQHPQAEGDERVMKCPNCGAKIDSHTNFCGECGRKIQ